MATVKRWFKIASKYISLISTIYLAIILFMKTLFPSSQAVKFLDELKGLKTFTVIVCIIYIFAAISKFSDKLNMWERIQLSKLFKPRIEMKISYNCYSNSKNENIYKELRDFISDSENGVSIRQTYSSENHSIISSVINGITYNIDFSMEEVDDNVFEKHIQLGPIVTDYLGLKDKFEFIDKIRTVMIVDNGGIIKNKQENYKVTLTFSNSTPFYRFTISELEKKEYKTLYNIQIPEKDGNVSIIREKGGPSTMIIKSSKIDFIRKTLYRYFIELDNV